MTTTLLYLVRHGQTVWHRENRYAGVSDVALTEVGRAQAERLAAWVADTRIDAVWVSPLRRARETAAPAAAVLRLPLRVADDLAEVDFGEAEGRTLAELPEAQAAAFRADPVGGAFPGAENPAAAAARGAAAVRRIARRHDAGQALVVAHNTLLRLTLCELLGIPLSRYRTVFPQLANGAVTELRLTDEQASLIRYNVPLAARVPADEAAPPG
ncbi:histidine phosphatase family protein [Streptomyces sp. B6B3]|uniref:histidine phosphatase family protein n=1 Tax=Streptomyces sp. B6B3 TaxID=3153570 RepID=UPI00325C4595